MNYAEECRKSKGAEKKLKTGVKYGPLPALFEDAIQRYENPDLLGKHLLYLKVWAIFVQTFEDEQEAIWK